MFENQIYCRNFNFDTIDDIYQDFLTITSDRFKDYVDNLNYSCLLYTYKDILYDWNLSNNKQRLINNNGDHYFVDYTKILSTCTYIKSIVELHYKYSQHNRKDLYCPIKAYKKSFEYFNNIENDQMKEMCIALFRGGYNWTEFLESKLKQKKHS